MSRLARKPGRAGGGRLLGGLPLSARPGLHAVVAPGRGRKLPFPLGYRLHARRVMILGLPWRLRGDGEGKPR